MTIQGQTLLRITTPESSKEKEADLLITINQVPSNQGYRYQYILKSRNDLGLNLNHVKCESDEIDARADQAIKSFFVDINRELTSYNFDANLLNDKLKNIGQRLYRQVVGNQLNDIYWKKIHGKIKSIQIITDDKDFFPWELLYPVDIINRSRTAKGINRSRTAKGFLCEIYNISRWLRGPDFPDIVKLGKLGLIQGDSSDLEAASSEFQEIKTLFQERSIEISCSRAGLCEVLKDENSKISAVHFIGHGTSRSAEQLSLKLANGEEFGINDVPVDGKAGLLIFLNACETGMTECSLSHLSGWAAIFIQELCGSAFIGSIWKVRDKPAHEFAKSFYEKLLEGKTFGEAAREARKSQTNIDPSALSYVIYANPLAKLILDDSPDNTVS